MICTTNAISLHQIEPCRSPGGTLEAPLEHLCGTPGGIPGAPMGTKQN